MKDQKIYMIGIGGSGMSGLARILKEQNMVSGSDAGAAATLTKLEQEGIQVFYDQKPENLPQEIDVVIKTAAVDEKNSELQEVRRRGLKCLDYSEAVGELTKQYKTVSIAGTHGKTTTTALLTAMMQAAHLDPTVIVGANIKELDNRNARLGRGKYFILESCEYRRAFLNYTPHIIILTNVEADHLDYYKDLEDYLSAFSDFIQKLPEDGLIIANEHDQNIKNLLKDFKKCKVIWYNMPKSELALKIPGKHNQMNASAVIALTNELNIDPAITLQALCSYTGSSRRFENKGTYGKTILIDDYGHHPTEIRTTLQAAREKFGPNAKILAVFQPHQYSRTFKLLDDFSESFKAVDQVIIPNIYEARDTAEDKASINEEQLVAEINKKSGNAIDGSGMAKTLEYLRQHASKFDVIITMGAGDVFKLAEALANSND